MDKNYRAFFGIKIEPFRSDLAHSEILQTDELKAVKSRFDYAVRLGGVALVTGEIGSGKSTVWRYSTEQLHPSEYKTFYITATSGRFWNCIARSQPKWESFNPATQRRQ